MKPEELTEEFQFRFTIEAEGGRLFAFKTEWAGGNWPEEHIASIWLNSDNTWRVLAWRAETGAPGGFELMGAYAPTFEEAFNYLWSLVQLGEVHFTFRKERLYE